MIIVITEILVIVKCQCLKAYNISVVGFSFTFRWNEGEQYLTFRFNIEDYLLSSFHVNIEADLAPKIL
jgi:hypothetical protein